MHIKCVILEFSDQQSGNALKCIILCIVVQSITHDYNVQYYII